MPSYRGPNDILLSVGIKGFQVQENEYDCGPAVVKTLANLYGKKTTMDELHKGMLVEKNGHIYTPKSNLRKALNDLGFLPQEFASRITHENPGPVKIVTDPYEVLLDGLAERHPAILNISYLVEGGGRSGHYVLATGYKNSGSELFIIDPAPENDGIKTIEKEELMNLWISGNGKWEKWLCLIRPSCDFAHYNEIMRK
ncbi:MAG: hypothetical protein GXO64_01150 [Candidatus Micrarchaeota archaeon]|nr:hypothetical protein [Candidatus Micrarchaeota archaeon]